MITVSAFYRFFSFPDYTVWREPLLAAMQEKQILGTVLLASEGVNGTVSGNANAIASFSALLETIHGCAPLTCKHSEHKTHPFGKAKVKLKKELISMGESASPLKAVGTYVKPENWNALVACEDIVLVDARNSYETHVGIFKNAIDPGTRTFKQLAGFSKAHLAEWKKKKIATYCTGGIRCEKYTAWLIEHGIQEVYHLEGGILNYLEKIPPEDSVFEGSCYVFDERIALDHGLEADAHIDFCKACGHSLSSEDRALEDYIQDRHCRYCDDYAPSNADYLRT